MLKKRDFLPLGIDVGTDFSSALVVDHRREGFGPGGQVIHSLGKKPNQLRGSFRVSEEGKRKKIQGRNGKSGEGGEQPPGLGKKDIVGQNELSVRKTGQPAQTAESGLRNA